MGGLKEVKTPAEDAKTALIEMTTEKESANSAETIAQANQDISIQLSDEVNKFKQV